MTLHEVIEYLESMLTQRATAHGITPGSLELFEQIAQDTGVSVDQVLHQMVALKYRRIKPHDTEGLDDTILDLAGYAVLWMMARKQRQEGT